MGELGPVGLRALRLALAEVLAVPVPLAVAGVRRPEGGWLLAEATGTRAGRRTHADTSSRASSGGPGDRDGDHERAVSSADGEAERSRLIALVELARGGDKEAFGQLYDHYHASIYRFLYYRVGSATLAEDLTADTFFRALRSMESFRWQGKDFGAWLTTIARNLATDHFKSGRSRLEQSTDDTRTLDTAAEGPEDDVLAGLANEVLLQGLASLPPEQRDCLVMRFLQGLTLAETAEALARSTGAVKQLQLRAVRNLAKLLPVEQLR